MIAFALFDQHGIAEAEEFVFSSDSFFIRLAHERVVKTGETDRGVRKTNQGTNEH